MDPFAKIWTDAGERYAQVSGEDFSDFPWPTTTEALCQALETQNGKYEDFRKQQAKLFSVLENVFKPIEVIVKLAADAASTMNTPIAIIFGALKHLINAAHGVSASLEAIAEMLGVLQNFTTRLKIYQREDLSQELREKLTEILVTVIEIFARSTKAIKDGIWYRFKTFGKNVLVGDDKTMQDLVTRLDKLTRTEDLVVAAETLVVTKQTARTLDSVQLSMEKLTTRENQLVTLIEESNAQATVEKDLKHLETVKKALNPSSLAQDRFDEIKREHAPGSGDWIRSEEALQKWTSSKAPLLWVSGNPGFGKSFLTYNIITYLHELQEAQNDRVSTTSIGYFFFRDNKDRTRSFEQALCDISYQISQTDKAYAKHVANVFHSTPDVTSIRSAWQKLFVDYFIGDTSTENSAFILLDGVDEAFSEGRATFFELLKDVQDADSSANYSSRLHIAMLGRPQITEDLSAELGDGLPTIEIDRTKNGDDIAQYVQLSIKKSPKLKRFPETLKQEIIQTLSAKAAGMFMWVKLMIAELSQKSRPSAIKEALNAAPKGLNEMLQHVLEGFSASLEEEDASDFNDMLAWVALAKRPISLGELDASLRLKSPDGEGVIYLEGRLRKQFASFFTLTREDNLTTSDLQTQKKIILDDDTPAVYPEHDEGMDDVENETDFDSNPTTTTISFSHASISDFLRDPKQGKVKANGEHPYVGVNVKESQLKIAQTCIDLIVDDSLLSRMKDAVSLQPYAADNWKDHLNEVDLSTVSNDDKVKIATSIARIFQEPAVIDIWITTKNQVFFRPETAKDILRWMTDENTLENLAEDTRSWIKSVEKNPIEIFESSVRRVAEKFLLPGGTFIRTLCMETMFVYISQKAGGTVDTVPKLSAEQVESTVLWAGLEETAEWNRRVAMSLRDLGWYDAALKHFDKAISLDPSMWIAKGGIVETYILQEKYQEALDLQQTIYEFAEADEKLTPEEKKSHLWDSHLKDVRCYEELAKTLTKISDIKEKVRLRKLVIDAGKKAFSYNDDDLQCIRRIIDQLWYFTHRDSIKLSEAGDEFREGVEIPNESECARQVMELLHMLDNIPKKDTTNLVKFLHKNMYVDGYLAALAEAAVERKELGWLQSKYREAIAVADKNRQTVISANLAVSLGLLYAIYGNKKDRAVRLWEAVGTARITSTALATDIGYARTTALNYLGRYYIREAIGDELKAPHYIAQMERIASKRQYGARIGVEDSIPPNDVALYLAVWYTKTGRGEEAREMVKRHVQEALILLSDDDPSNDIEAYQDLSRALLAMGDEINALAVYYAMRKINAEKQPTGNTISNEETTNSGTVETAKKDEDVSNIEKNEDANIELQDDANTEPKEVEDDFEAFWCDGVCEKFFPNYDGAVLCRYCLYEFEKDCHKSLMDGKLLPKICSKDHSFIVVPALSPEHMFKEGEISVEGKIVSLDEWKRDLRKQHRL